MRKSDGYREFSDDVDARPPCGAQRARASERRRRVRVIRWRVRTVADVKQRILVSSRAIEEECSNEVSSLASSSVVQRVRGRRNRAYDETRQHPTQFFLFVLFVSHSHFFFHVSRRNGPSFFFPRFPLEPFFSFAQSLAFYVVQVLSLRPIRREFCFSREPFPQR